MTKKIINSKPIKTPKQSIAFSFNIMLVLLEILAIVFLFTVPIERYGGVTAVGDWRSFKYFTIDSNILLMFACLTSSIYIGLYWNGTIKKIPQWDYIFKLIAVIGVTLTMFITLFVLLPGAIATKQFAPRSLYLGHNLFMHLICPLSAIILFLLFENRKDIKLVKTLWCLIPIVIYCIFYLSMAYTHMNPETGKPFPDYDWYRFCSFGPIATPFLVIGMIGMYYLFTWLLWLCNKKIDVKGLK